MLATAFFLAGERLRHDRLLRQLGQLEVDLLFFLERLREKLGTRFEWLVGGRDAGSG